jgi:phage/plasmid primase-like uncharacterized protein
MSPQPGPQCKRVPAEQIQIAQGADILRVAMRFTALKPQGANECAGPCPVCGGTDRFSVNTRKQLWNCRGCSKGGNVISLVSHALGVSFAEAIDDLAGTAPKNDTPRRKTERDNLGFATAIWKETLPLTAEAKAYFTARDIDIDAAPAFGGMRFHARCPWGANGFTAPCIIARFTDAITNQPRGIWRKRIDNPAEKPRTLGPMQGCVIRLWPDEEVTTGLVIGEGVETTLAAATRIEHRGTLLQPAWACGGSGNLSALPVLAGIESLTILVDNDGNGSGQRAAETCARRWLNAGRDAIRLTPKTLCFDFNDVVRSRNNA